MLDWVEMGEVDFKKWFEDRCVYYNFTDAKKFYGAFLWMGINCLKTAEPLLGDNLLFTTKSPEVSGTHLMELWRMKDWIKLGTTQWSWTQFLNP